MRARAVMGPYDWAALMQQNPLESGGVVFNRAWLNNTYTDDPQMIAQNMEEILQSWDMTFKEGATADFVVGQVWGRRGADYYLLDQVRLQCDFPTAVGEFRNMTAKWPKAVRKLVEEAANGYAIVQSLKHQIPGIISVKPLGGKIVRAQAVAPTFESGNVYLPIPKNAPWIHDFREEVAMFPNVAHDDQVDAMSQAISNILSRGSGILPPNMDLKPVFIESDVNSLFVTPGRRGKRLTAPRY